MKKIDFSSASKMYILGIIVSIVALFIVTGVVFLCLVANKLDIVMNSSPGVTYTYFVMVMDRIIIFLMLFVLFPLTLYQLVSQDKNTCDKAISCVSVLVLIAFLMILLGGEMRFFEKYSTGELAGAELFKSPTLEINLFDKLLNKS